MDKDQTSERAASPVSVKESESHGIFPEVAAGSSRGWARPLLYFLRRYWVLHLISLVVSLGVGLFESLSVATILPLLSSLFNLTGENVQAGRLMTWLYRVIDFFPMQDKVMAACFLLLSVATLKFLMSFLGDFLAAYSGGKIVDEIKRELLQKFYRLPYSFFLEHKQGDLKHIIMYGTQRVSFCLWAFPLWLTELFKIAGLVTLLMFLHFQFALLIIGVGLGFYSVVGYVSRKISYSLGKSSSLKLMEQINLLDELFTGVKHIILFRVFPHWLRQYSVSSKIQITLQRKQAVISGMPKNLLELGAMAIILGAIFFIRGSSAVSPIEAVPMMGLFALAIVRIMPSLSILSRTTLDLMAQLPDVALVFWVLTAPLPEVRSGRKLFSRLEHSIVFDGVVFGYPNREEILKGVDVTFRKNQMTAIVGRSGEGKTTLINLLLGLYEPQKGAIRIDGVDLREFDVESWRARIGLVSQDPFIFHATVVENIAFGDESFSRQEIIEAACLANADEFIRQLPEGYDTLVGERGMKLSGGQQQRLAIARAILRKPEILIFDEATSSLDNISEKLVQEAISRISQDRTVLLIAHRSSTIESSDKIVVLHNGVCAEEGTHEQLMRSNGFYCNQVRGELAQGVL